LRVINGKRITTISDTTICGFFGEYRFLSNVHMCPVRVCGITYPSSEHAYMALKTTDEDERLRIQQVVSPYAAKALSREFTLRDGWDEHLRLIAMRKVVLAKFRQNKDLGKKLLATGTKLLEETNNWGDTFWGVNMQTRKGHNHLGLTLMSVRYELSL
jgi:ribA/ribD-fused uncharacterized protein